MMATLYLQITQRKHPRNLQTTRELERSIICSSADVKHLILSTFGETTPIICEMLTWLAIWYPSRSCIKPARNIVQLAGKIFF